MLNAGAILKVVQMDVCVHMCARGHSAMTNATIGQ